MKDTFCGRLALLTVLIICFGSTAFSQISQTWQVEKYDLSVKHAEGAAERFLDVIAKLRLRNIGTSSASSLTLRLSQDAEVSVAAVGGETREINLSQEKVGSATLQRIQMRLPAVRPGEEVDAEITYRLKVQENGPLASLSSHSSQFLPLSFWYPTPNSWFFARGADYAPMTISFGGDSRRTFLSNGAVDGVAFSSKLNVQPFFVSGSWDKVQRDGLEFFVPRGSTSEEKRVAEDILSLAADARTFLARQFGWTPDESLRLVSVRRGGGFSSGGTLLLEEAALRRGRIDSQTFMTIAEAVAKMFLSDGIRITGDGHGMIREGLSRYLAVKFLESRHGAEVASVERARQRNAYSGIASRDGAITQLSPLDDIYYNSSANKGAIIWRLIERDLGADFAASIVSKGRQSGSLTLTKLRAERPDYSRYFSYFLDELTTGNLLAGIPQSSAPGKVTVALRNTMPIPVEVRVRLMTEDGEGMYQSVQIAGSSFGQAVFETSQRAIRAEIDPDGFFIQSDYSDDVAPKRFSESDLLILVKRPFDKQEYSIAENLAREVLQVFPKMDEVRVLLARALLAQGNLQDAEQQFRILESEKAINSRSVSWTAVGLGEIAEKRGAMAEAQSYFELAIRSEGELGAVLLARQGRVRINRILAPDESVRAFFQQFDRAAVSNRKSEIDALIAPGEIVRFSAGISGQAQQWVTSIVAVDRISDGTVIVETKLSVKLLNRNPEQGTAIFRLFRAGSEWRLEGIEFFDVR
jgi:hypothetical protein